MSACPRLARIIALRCAQINTASGRGRSGCRASLRRRRRERISSAVARVEVLRALRRAAASAADYRRGEQVLERLGLVRVDDGILAAAAALDQADLRALDAIHLATALAVQGELAALVTHDQRLAEAAAGARLTVRTPA